MFKKKKQWLTLICILIGAFLLSMILYKITVEPPTFLTIRSPGGTYTVNLTGQKERPIFFTAEVRFYVLKKGETFWSNEYLHSGDAFDLSFEAGYPDYRWLDENILHFYRKQNFSEKKLQVVIVINSTNKVVKHLKIECLDKFLLFDMQPGSKTVLSASPPKGNTSGIKIKGKFYEGRTFEKNSTFKINVNEPLIYYIYITDDNIIIESHGF